MALVEWASTVSEHMVMVSTNSSTRQEAAERWLVIVVMVDNVEGMLDGHHRGG